MLHGVRILGLLLAICYAVTAPVPFKLWRSLAVQFFGTFLFEGVGLAYGFGSTFYFWMFLISDIAILLCLILVAFDWAGAHKERGFVVIMALMGTCILSGIMVAQFPEMITRGNWLEIGEALILTWCMICIGFVFSDLRGNEFKYAVALFLLCLSHMMYKLGLALHPNSLRWTNWNGYAQSLACILAFSFIGWQARRIP